MMPQVEEQVVPPLPGFLPSVYAPGPEVAEEFKDLMWLAQEQGYLTPIDIGEALGEHFVRPEDINAIRLTISKLDVKIVEPPEFVEPPASEAGTPAKPDGQTEGLSDPVKIYFRQMGQFSLLTPEGEAELFGRIETAAREIRRTMYSFGFMAREHIALAERLLADPPRERIERVMVDAKVESRQETLAMLRRLVKQVRSLDSEADRCFREWREARGDERAKRSDEFQRTNSATTTRSWWNWPRSWRMSGNTWNRERTATGPPPSSPRGGGCLWDGTRRKTSKICCA
jgi:Sigma-70 factor, region 1.2/Sigma-70 factor, region 1.1